MPGEALMTARYLGPQSISNQNYGAELNERIAAMTKSYSACGAFWGSANMPWRWRRTVLICRVISARLP
eukprot:8844075-Pyramimonas_sp.AAC.1